MKDNDEIKGELSDGRPFTFKVGAKRKPDPKVMVALRLSEWEALLDEAVVPVVGRDATTARCKICEVLERRR